MSKGVVVAFLAPLLLAAGKKPAVPPDPVALAVTAAGPYNKYLRVETVSYAFEETRPGSTEKETGRHFFRLHDAGGFRAREERRVGGRSRVTVVSASGTWAFSEGVAVADPAALERARRDLMDRAFRFLLPYNLKEAGMSARFLPSDQFGGRVVRRVEVEAGGSGAYAPAPSFTVYVDSATHKLQGLRYVAPGETSPSFFYNSDKTEAAVLSWPSAWTAYAQDMKDKGEFRLSDLKINDYLDEALFSPDLRSAMEDKTR